MFAKNNTDKVSKEMQIAAFKEALKNLKELEEFSRYEIDPILKTVKNILSCYNCIPNKCLEKRVQYLLNNIHNTNEIKINIKCIIVEIETLITANTENTEDSEEKESPI